MTRSTKTERYVELLRAAVKAARELNDELDAALAELGPSDEHAASLRLADALDDLDAYCATCDDEGVVEQTRTVSTAYVGPPLVDVVPCDDCEASRVLSAQREAAREAEARALLERSAAYR